MSDTINAVNAEAEGKDVWRGLAKRHELAPIILEVVVSDQALHRRRVVARQKAWTSWTELTLRLDAADEIAVNVGKALRYIQGRE